MKFKPLCPALFAVLFAIVLSGCTAYSHRVSIERLEQNYQARLDAEKAALENLKVRPNPTEGGEPNLKVEREPSPSIGEASLALALDAQQDLEDVTSTFVEASEYDRVSALYRASLKVWHAGNAWQNAAPESDLDPNTPDAISREGRERCDALKENAPPRDCAIIIAAPNLRVMEIAAKDIFDAHIARRNKVPPSEKRLALIFKSIRDIETEMAALQGKTTKELAGFMSDELGRFFAAQQVVYFCDATRGVDDLVRIDVLNADLQKHGKEAADWLRGLSSADSLSQELRTLLEHNDVKRLQASAGAYARLLGRTNLIVLKKWKPTELRVALNWCNDWSEWQG